MDPLLRSDLELAARKSPGERLAEALELMEWGIQMKLARLREQHPDATEPEIERLLVAWLCRND